MGVRDCLDLQKAYGALSSDRAEALKRRLDDLEKYHRLTMGEGPALHQAEVDLVEELSAQQARNKELASLLVLTQDRVSTVMDTHPQGPAAGAQALIDRDIYGHHEVSNVAALENSIRGQAHGLLAGVFHRFRPSVTGGARDRIGQGELIRAIFGEASDGELGVIGKAWGSLAESLRQRAEKAGIAIAKLDGWAITNPLPDARKVAEMGFLQFRETLEPLLDPRTFDRMGVRKAGFAQTVEEMAHGMDEASRELGVLRQEQSAKTSELRRVGDKKEAAQKAAAQAEGELKGLLQEGQSQVQRYGETGPTRPYDQGRKRRTSDQVARDRRQAPKARESGRNIDRLAERRAAIRDRLAGAQKRLADATDREAALRGRLDQIDTHLGDWQNRYTELKARQKVAWDNGGKLPAAVVDEAEKLEFFRAVFETLASDGLNKVKPSLAPGGGGKSLGRKYEEAHRVLHYKDAESWLAAHEAFGSGSPFDAVKGHIDRMAHDIAVAEVFGPNPEAMKGFIRQEIARRTGAAKVSGLWKKADQLRSGEHTFSKRFDDVVLNLPQSPVSERLARNGANLRSLLVSAQLGSAFVSSITDVGTMALTAAFNGIPASKVLARSLSLMVSSKDQVAAVQMGLIAEGWSRIAAAGVRYEGDYLRQGWAQRLAHTVMEGSLLGPATRARQWAYGMETLGTLGRLVEQSWDGLPRRLRGALDRYGLDAASWDVIRQAPLFSHDGARFVDLTAIARMDHPRAGEIATSLHRAIITERDFAVVGTDSYTRLYTNLGGMPPGTLGGELARAFGMYKAYGVTSITTHVMRGLQQASLSSKAAYLAAYAGSVTVLGMAALQAKAILKGQDTLDMKRWDTWGAAFMQGGGAGILGDFLASSTSRTGGGLAEAITGPAVGAGMDLGRLTLGNLERAREGKEVHLWMDLVKTAGRYTPGSSLWYGRLAMERLLLDQLALMDPQSRKGFARLERQALKERGQGYWWRRGYVMPERLPSMGGQ